MVGRGKLLLSEPYLGDPNFERTVILITEENESGSVGFVLNKPSEITLDAVLSEINDFPENLFIGGPVAQDSLHFIYTGEVHVENSIEIMPDVFWGGSYEHLLELINLKLIIPENFRFFIGYSGWGEGQLEMELEQNAWIISDATKEDIFSLTPESMWRLILSKMGGKYKMFSNFPVDPRFN